MTTENENSAESQDARIGKVIDRKYKILSRVGVGGMGVVYEAEHELMGRRVAVKVLHRHLVSEEQFDTFMQRFQREARTASQINHPNAVTIYDFGISRGMAYLVMEFVEGRSLKSVLATEGRLNTLRAVDIFSQVCEAVSAAHKLGIVHRDLKPDNIMLSSDGDGKETAQVLDFGIAKVLTATAQDTSLTMTQAGTTLGTPRYMSPEQVLGKTIDARSDVYALGVVLYEMLTGDIPFKADSAMELMLKHVSEAPLPMRTFDEGSNIPKGVEAVVMKALEKSAENRYQAVGELSFAFRAAVKKSEGTSGVIPTAVKAKRAPRPSAKDVATVAATAISRQIAAGKKYTKPISIGVGVAVLVAVVSLLALTQDEEVAPTQLAKTETPAKETPTKTEKSPAREVVVREENTLPQPEANKILNAENKATKPESPQESVPVTAPELQQLDSAKEAMQSLLALEESAARSEPPVAQEVTPVVNVAPTATVSATPTPEVPASQVAVVAKTKTTPEAPANVAPENMRARLSDTANPADTLTVEADKKFTAEEPVVKPELQKPEAPKPDLRTTKVAPVETPPKAEPAKPVVGKSPAVDTPKSPTPAAAKADPLSNRSVAQLIDALKDEKREVREQAGRLLQTRGQEPVAPLIQAMNNPSVRVRYWATFILGQLRAKDAVPVLIRALNDKVPMISQTAEGALRKIGTPEALRAIKVDPDSVTDKTKKDDGGWLW